MKLRNYVKHKYKIFIGVSFKIIEAVIEILLPIGMSLMIDNGILKNDKNYILIASLMLIGLIIVAFISSITAQYYAYDISENYVKELRVDMYKKISKFSPTQYNEFTQSSLANRLTLDAYQSGNAISMSIRTASRAPFLVIGSLIAIYTIHPQFALILLISAGILLPLLVIFLRQSMKNYKEVQRKNDDLTKVVKSNLTGMRIIRAFRGEQKETTKFKVKNKDITKTMNKLNLFQLLTGPTTTIFMYTTLVIILFMAIPIANSGEFSISRLASIVTYTTQLTVALVSVMNLVMIYTRSISSNIRIRELLNMEIYEETEDKFLLPESIDSIEFENISYTYPRRSKPSVKNINLDLKKGEIIGLTGKTGSGKSTIMQMLAGYYSPQDGTILINGIPYNNFKLSDLRRKIGYVSQRAEFLKGTIYENIVMGNYKITEERVIEALKKAEAYDFVMKKPNGIYSLVEEKGTNFSGGQRQRLSLARAFANNYEVLILDDSFSALDFLTESMIRNRILTDFKDKILVLISVRKSTLLAANRIYVIDKGEIEAEGNNELLLHTSPLYGQLVED
ncbi:ABC transporter ATP-binding protein [Acholeplasma hippikon]|uniref:ABC-type multidrug/protein/lipid transport system ATPase component n=1 Tax=Acholeplasma hippikon TaxID=264636 RepID=A0A449BIG3_9MOLU|nr:ABC transporter ATP-binding protein [Acholeplasma hippikon]VEU82222.1 ABC-type multidrug/protein/lipid transport system ATPase component [Acholeplasma hippikon]